jgi:hypothetical protein
MCLDQSIDNLLDLLDLHNHIQPETFYRCNSDPRSIHKHCLLCLMNFLCQS